MQKIVEVINTINPEFPLELKERTPRPKPERAWGTDSGTFAVRGVPNIGFDCGDPKGYNFDYREIWYTSYSGRAITWRKRKIRRTPAR